MQSDEKKNTHRTGRREEMPNLGGADNSFCCRNSVELQSLFVLGKGGFEMINLVEDGEDERSTVLDCLVKDLNGCPSLVFFFFAQDFVRFNLLFWEIY